VFTIAVVIILGPSSPGMAEPLLGPFKCGANLVFLESSPCALLVWLPPTRPNHSLNERKLRESALRSVTA